MRGPSIVAAISIILFVVFLGASIFAWAGPTHRYRYAHGSYYHGGLFFWGVPVYGAGTSPGRLGGGRSIGGGFRGGGTSLGK
ncbi:MAG: hypothetical protein GY847_10900 [Proteobacteria bacterium]|nr:hypothetical protein [Pseudomonadota bacterium]